MLAIEKQSLIHIFVKHCALAQSPSQSGCRILKLGNFAVTTKTQAASLACLLGRLDSVLGRAIQAGETM